MLHTQYQEFSNLTVRSQNLLELKIYAKFEELHLETPKLVTLLASLYENFRDVSEIQSKYKNNTNRFMCFLPEIQNLKICWNFTRYLASGVPEQLSINLNYLTDLAIGIDCACSEHIDLVVCLLQCAPKLRSFHIQFNSEEFIHPSYPSHWESTGTTGCQLHQLQIVKGGGEFLDLKCIVAFIKFVLRSAPILEEVELEKRSFDSMIGRKKFLLQLLELPRLSNKAIIKIVDI